MNEAEALKFFEECRNNINAVARTGSMCAAHLKVLLDTCNPQMLAGGVPPPIIQMCTIALQDHDAAIAACEASVATRKAMGFPA